MKRIIISTLLVLSIAALCLTGCEPMDNDMNGNGTTGGLMTKTPALTNTVPNNTGAVTPDNTTIITPNVTSTVTPDITPDMTPDITPDVTPDVSPIPDPVSPFNYRH